MTKQILNHIYLDKQEKYILGKSLIDAWGYPYRPKKVKVMFDHEEYKKVDEKLNKTDFDLHLDDLPLILNSLELLYYENGDFVALYDNVTKDDVKALYDKLEKIYNGSKAD